MRIKKILDAVGLVGNILNKKSISKKDAYSCDYINKLNTYSTEEQVIGTWIDGKPLYRKVVGGTFPTDTNGVHITSIPNVEKLINTNGYILGADGVCYEFGKSANIDTHVQVSRAIVLNNTIVLQCTTGSFSDCNYEVCVEYTKTTD